MKIGILNFSKSELTDFFIAHDIPKFRANQVFSWLYNFGKLSFFEMSNIGKSLQEKLDTLFYIYRPVIQKITQSTDGTIKFLLELNDQNKIETVFIPEIRRNQNNEKSWERATICVSSQVGCSVGCLFCNTGYAGFIRNLSSEEITTQLLIVKDYLNLWTSDDRISNIVFMGMGEPLYNYSAVNTAMENIISDSTEHGISRRKITLSTSGISNVLLKIAKDLTCRLAISLHAPNDDIRSSIMPINNIHNIESVLNACSEYYFHHSYLKITFEYLLLNGVNDSKNCAYELLELLAPLNAKVNLIQFNQWDGCDFTPSSKSKTEQFAQILEAEGLEAPIRKRRGEDIMAACGQLSFLNKNIENS